MWRQAQDCRKGRKGQGKRYKKGSWSKTKRNWENVCTCTFIQKVKRWKKLGSESLERPPSLSGIAGCCSTEILWEIIPQMLKMCHKSQSWEMQAVQNACQFNFVCSFMSIFLISCYKDNTTICFCISMSQRLYICYFMPYHLRWGIRYNQL